MIHIMQAYIYIYVAQIKYTTYIIHLPESSVTPLHKSKPEVKGTNNETES